LPDITPTQFHDLPPMTLMQCINAQSARLQAAGVSFGHGTDNAHDEAAWLALWALGLPVNDLDSVTEREVKPAEKARISALVNERIASRKPAAYLTQEAWLQGVPFHCDERAIVPRSLIAEVLADGLIDPWLGEHSTKVLDLCSGNGSLAVLAALAFPDITVVATDIDQDALGVAHFNVKKHELQDRIKLVVSDVFSALEGQTFDLILCNPPYVNSAAMQALPPEYQAEPELALAGGLDGMDLIRRIIAQASKHLSNNGVLVLEIGNEYTHFVAAFPKLEAVWLETSAGETQVLLLTHESLIKQ
jgi:ribosomal protein L3 glutamine methyltransferase